MKEKLTEKEIKEIVIPGMQVVKKLEDSMKPKKQLNCFIIMPFSEATFINKEGNERKLGETELTHIYEELFEKAITNYQSDEYEFTNIHRSNAKSGNFVKKIVNSLQDYEIVLADLTGFNPNVFYELGIRHTLKNGTIMLTQNKKYLPSDLASYIAFEYNYPTTPADFDAYYPTFEEELHLVIDNKLEILEESDNPVRDFLGDKIIFKNEIRIKEIERNIEFMIRLQLNYQTTIHSYLSNIEQWVKGKATSATLDCLKVLAEPFLGRLINLGENIEVIEFVTSLIDALEVNRNNISYIKKKLLKTRNPKDIRDAPFAFFGFNNVKYHILDLMKYYDYSDEKKLFICNTINNEPIIKAFTSFRDKWKKELEGLTK